ncbi:MAG: DUF4831 family protein [Prevotellaceae bacterium]|jgi:hypothetical protein|nr:DUF4831 family protein [Prevotellaceae bacterium]
MKKILIILVILFVNIQTKAQVLNSSNDAQIVANSVVYALPRTSIKIKIEVEKETFVAGPYAQYAEKYLGIEVDTRNHENYSIRKIEMLPFKEADANTLYTINFGKMKNARANFLDLSSEGLLFFGDHKYERNMASRFETSAERQTKFLDTGAGSNYTSERAVYYGAVKTDTGIVQVPIERWQKTGKNIEAKAAEVAELINKLRKERIDIVTGESDFTGEGLTAVLAEIRKMEADYMLLFIGKSTKTNEIHFFDVIPDAAQIRQSYIAFRFSEKQGLIPANNVSGRPIILTLEKETTSYEDAMTDADAKKNKVELIYYRVPLISKVSLLDGTNVLIQDRFPIYQLGNILSMPADLQMK